LFGPGVHEARPCGISKFGMAVQNTSLGSFRSRTHFRPATACLQYAAQPHLNNVTLRSQIYKHVPEAKGPATACQRAWHCPVASCSSQGKSRNPARCEHRWVAETSHRPARLTLSPKPEAYCAWRAPPEPQPAAPRDRQELPCPHATKPGRHQPCRKAPADGLRGVGDPLVPAPYTAAPALPLPPWHRRCAPAARWRRTTSSSDDARTGAWY
jgi:hypothetical protein